MSRLLPLAFLAPDIVEAILEGHHPADLSAARLTMGSEPAEVCVLWFDFGQNGAECRRFQPQAGSSPAEAD